jgi:hypothetical protein
MILLFIEVCSDMYLDIYVLHRQFWLESLDTDGRISKCIPNRVGVFGVGLPLSGSNLRLAWTNTVMVLWFYKWGGGGYFYVAVLNSVGLQMN